MHNRISVSSDHALRYPVNWNRRWLQKERGGIPADRDHAIETARGLIGGGRLAEAEELLRRGIPSPSKDAEALRLRGWIAERMSQPAEMKSLAEKSLRIESHPEGHSDPRPVSPPQ